MKTIITAVRCYFGRLRYRRIRWREHLAAIARGPVIKRDRGCDEIDRIYKELEQAADA